MPFVIPRSWRRAGVAAVTALAALGTVADAHAAPANPDGCVVDHALIQPFAAWGDTADYALAPGGDFEQAGWRLSGVAARVAGNQPYDIGAGGDTSLLLAAGATATSPPMCIDDTYPHFRFFLRGTAAKVRAEVLFLDEDGSVQERDASTVEAGRGWQPSPNMAIDVPWAGSAAPVQFRFTAKAGLVQLDDVYVDPWGRG